MEFNSAVKSAILLALVSFLSACASTEGVSLAEKQTAIAGYQLPSGPNPDEAIVYIVRPDTVGFAVRFKIYLDGKREEGTYVGYTRGEQYLAFPVSVGNHVVHSKAENWSSVDISAEAGDIIFLRQTPQMGFFISANYLEEIDVVDGKYLMVTYDLERGTYVDQDMVPYGPPEELAAAKNAEETASNDAEDGSVETTSSSSAKTDPSAATYQFLGIWTGEIFNNPTVPMIVEFKIDQNDSVSATGSVTNHTGAAFDLQCGGADVTLKLQDPDNVYIKFKSPTCSGSGVVALVDNNKLEGKIKIGGRNWGLKFRNITRETASGDAEDGSVETTSSSSAKTGPSAATDQFLGVWAGEIFNNPDLPMIVEIKIDENDSVSASGSIVNQASSFRLNCNNAEVTLKLQDADNVYIKFKNPTCGGSGVVSLVGNNRLKGKITLEGRSWDLNFTKSSGS